MPDVFLSYKREDLKAATRLVKALRAEGLEVWWDRDIPASAPWETTIEKVLAEARVVLVCWSKAAVASDNVRSEARWAREHGRLMQTFVKPCEPPLFFGERQGVDLSTWQGEPSDPRFRQVVEGVRAIIDGEPRSPSTSPDAQAGWRQALASRKFGLGLIAMALVLLAGVAALRWAHPGASVAGQAAGSAPQRSAAGQTLRVATTPFELLDTTDAGARKFAADLQAETANQLTQSGIDVALPAGGGAAFALGGSVERDGADFVVRVQLTDERQHAVVWSDTYRRATEAASVLQDEVAATVAEVAATAIGVDPIAKGDAEVTLLMIKASLYAIRNRPDEFEASWENDKLLLAKRPHSSLAHADFAADSAALAPMSTPEHAAELRTLAAHEADAALKLNPRDTVAYYARVVLVPQVGHWAERQRILQGGLKAIPDGTVIVVMESNLLREVGRLRDAVVWGRQAAAPQPPSANRDATLLLALSAAGVAREAAALADTDGRAWPVHDAVWNSRLETLIDQNRWAEATALFAPNAYRPIGISDSESRAWIAALKAMASGRATARQQAARLLAAFPSEPSVDSLLPHVVYTAGDRIAMLAVLGDNDDAYAGAARYLRKDGLGDSSFLFWPGLQAFRRDPRFWPLASSIGLVDYWRSTGDWPDFCSEPGLPYDCKAEAAKLGAAPQAKA